MTTQVTQAEMKRLYPELSAATKQVAAVKDRCVVGTSMGTGAEFFDDGSMEFGLPLPFAELSPNARCHWRTKAAKVKRYRMLARVVAIFANEPLWQSATVQCTFTFPDRRKRDTDNLLASMKAAFDGFADAGIVANDSGFIHLPIVIAEPDKARCGVMVRITKGTDQ